MSDIVRQIGHKGINMDAVQITDYDGYVVNIGDVVGYREEFLEPDNCDKYYYVTRFPNLGDMVEMSECLLGENGEITDILRETVISVEPYKISAI